jgi:hypothetical protein
MDLLYNGFGDAIANSIVWISCNNMISIIKFKNKVIPREEQICFPLMFQRNQLQRR